MVDEVEAKIGKYMVKMAKPRRAKKRKREEEIERNSWEDISRDSVRACERFWEMTLYQGKSGNLP